MLNTIVFITRKKSFCEIMKLKKYIFTKISFSFVLTHITKLNITI